MRLPGRSMGDKLTSGLERSDRQKKGLRLKEQSVASPVDFGLCYLKGAMFMRVLGILMCSYTGLDFTSASSMMP